MTDWSNLTQEQREAIVSVMKENASRANVALPSGGVTIKAEGTELDVPDSAY